MIGQSMEDKMNISITPELEKLVSFKVASGMYQSASEVIREALRLLADRDEVRRKRMEKLDQEIQFGLDQAARGEFCDPDWLDSELERGIAVAESKK
jgi:antitoxin ParD1/3/4